MATQLDFQASPPSMQENLPAAKKRKRGNNGDEATNPSKRNNLQEVNGNMSADSSLPDAAQFPDPNASNNNPFPSHPGSQQDDTSAAMAAALQAHGAQMQHPYPGGMEHGGFDLGSPSQGAPQPYMQAYGQQAPHTPTGASPIDGQGPPGSAGAGGANKPAVGSDEWHRVRRDNHKEVERRRRETINEGINELAKIVPGNEKNKGSILQRTVTYIRELQSNQDGASAQRTLEKQLLEQAVDELSRHNDRLKESNKSLQDEREQLQMANARLARKVRELGGTVDLDDEPTKVEH